MSKMHDEAIHKQKIVPNHIFHRDYFQDMCKCLQVNEKVENSDIKCPKI